MANQSILAAFERMWQYITSALDNKSDLSHNHDSDYDSKGSASSALASAKSYTDTKFESVPSVDTYTKSEIDSAFDEIDEAIAEKANSSHNHNDLYYTETEIDNKLASKADETHNHDAAYDAKGSASAVQTNLNAVSDTLDSHTEDSDIHVTTTNKSNWNSAYTHSTSTHARTDATKVADSTTNGNILINGTETNVYSHPNSGVTAGTYKSVTVNAQGHVTAGTNPTTLAGYGITDAESKGAASSALASAKEYTDTVASGKSDTGHNHDSAYDSKGSASSALASAKTYADSAATTAANKVKNDLLNGAGTAFDTLKELGDLITDNQDAIDALETVASGKADVEHSHAISDVSGLQSALDGKAASSHGTHVSYSTTAPVMDGTASVGSASTVARSDHKHPTDTSRASKTEFDTHASNTTVHITSTERSNWNAAKTHADSAHAPSNAEKNQNAFSNITVGSTTVAADSATDTVTFVGSNVTITPDATNDKITFAVADGSTSAKGLVQLTNSTSSTSTTTAATPSSVKSAYDLANTAKTNAATAQTRADSAYSLAESKADSLSDLGVTATATELNYVDGVTSNIQTQLDGKAASGHTHNYAGSSSAGGAATSANKVNSSLTVKLNSGTTEGTNMFTFNGSAAKAVNITPSAIGAAASSHTHDDRYYTESEIDSKVSTLNTAINGKAASSHTHSISNVTNLQSTLDGKLPKSGGTMTGPITFSNVSGNTKSSNYLSAGGGYGTGSGRLGLKVVALDQTDAQMGMGVDLGGGPYELSVATSRSSNTQASKITFLTHTTETNAYKTLGYFLSSGAENPTATFNVAGTIQENGTALSSKYAASSHTHNYAGSSSAGGSATSAVKLDSSAGSATQPVYFSGGKPVATTYTLGASVPSGAKFTDTTYSAATTSAAGLMSAADKTKLDGIATGANNYTYTLPAATSSALGGVKVGSNITNSSGTISLTKSNVTSALGYTPPTTNTTYSAATQSANGLMSAADKKKLDGIATGANNYTYTLPTASSSTLGGVKTTSTVTSTSGLTACPIISGVPYYKDTNTAVSHQHAGETIKPLCLEMTPGSSAGHGGFIDFHYNGNTADYTSRIIEYEKGYVALNGHRIITAENLVAIYGQPVTFSAGKGTLTNSFIKSTSIVIVQMMADVAGMHYGFNTASKNGSVDIYTDTNINFAVNLNMIIINP